MTARTHDLATVTALGIVFLTMSLPTMTLSTAILTVFANLIGGITPDIDQPTAPLWRNLPIGRLFSRTFHLLTGGHRFLTHSLLGVALFGFATHWLLIFLHPIMTTVDRRLVWYGFMIGLVSHLVMDSFTKEGVPWLLPIPVKFGFPPFKGLRITTGKKLETFVVFPGLVIINVAFIYAHYHHILDILHRHIV